MQRGWRVLEAVNAELRGSAAEGRLSYADLVALGGAWAVRATGGPAIEVPVGAAVPSGLENDSTSGFVRG